MNTRADRGDWDMHPSDLEPESERPGGGRVEGYYLPQDVPEPDEADAYERDRVEHEAEAKPEITSATKPAVTDDLRFVPGCMTQRRRRSLDEEEADKAGDRYEADYWKRSEG